jgi:hypothetical protein
MRHDGVYGNDRSQGLVVILSNLFWHRVAWLVRLDMAAGIALAIVLLLWLQWN